MSHRPLDMSTPDVSSALTAAECAARTGLTPRALRLYEEHGLITPGRTAGGWRQYGPQELLRLNVITLLKTAGLTLAQIAHMTTSGTSDVDLHQILSIQLENWRAKRLDAERGQRIVEAALERLGATGSLTTDELCNLIRSLEMSQPPEPGAGRTDETDAVSIDESVLEQYAGFYQVGEWIILTVRRDGSRLVAEFPGRPATQLRPTSESDFEMDDVTGMPITFDRGSDGTVSALRMRMKGGDIPATRVDSATAEQVRARLAQRIENQHPLPGSEEAVRRLVEGLISGQPDYDTMHPALAYVARAQMPGLHTAAAYLGAVKSIDFQGVGSQGWDVYDVHHERGTSRVRIMLRPDGQVTGALFVVKDGPLSLGP
jgi:DNA-binding transcriptional MerR regulator